MNIAFFFQTFASVCAALFGVQNEKNRNRDFNQGKPAHYIFIGIMVTGLLIAIILAVVQVVLNVHYS